MQDAACTSADTEQHFSAATATGGSVLFQGIVHGDVRIAGTSLSYFLTTLRGVLTSRWLGCRNCNRYLTSLQATDPSLDKRRIELDNGGLLVEVCRWILDNADFQRWRDDEENRLLWVKGDPGTGKTMMLCGIVDELRAMRQPAASEVKPPLSFFFCQATNSLANNALAVLRGLIYLLIDQYPDLVSHLPESFYTSKVSPEDKNAWLVLSDTFNSIVQHPGITGTYTIIIDAIDECEVGTEQLLELIVQTALSSRVKWLISSRNRADIERQLKPLGLKRLLTLELREHAEYLCHAVGAYIDRRIAHLECIDGDDALREQVRGTLHEQAGGTFLWVSFVLKELSRVEKWNVEQVLKHTPPGLYDVYDRMMQQITQLKATTDIEFCRTVLAAVTLTYRPLHIPELIIVSGLPRSVSSHAYAVGRIIDMCGSFLILQDGQVLTIHPTAKDYLKANYVSCLQPQGIIDGHLEIYRRSIEAMLKTERDISVPSDFGLKPEEVATPDPDPLAPIRYSCVFWPDHLIEGAECMGAKAILADQGTLLSFLTKQFLHWLEMLSLIGKTAEGTQSLQSILRIVQVCLYTYHYNTTYLIQPQRSSPRLAAFLQDAVAFLRSYGSLIKHAPLQTYGSALVFSPKKSEVKNALWQNRLPFIRRTAGIGHSACRQTFEGHTGPVTDIAFTPDGESLASATIDHTTKLWDLRTGICRSTPTGDGDLTNRPCWFPDGWRLGFYDHRVFSPSGMPMMTLRSRIRSAILLLSPDNETLAATSANYVITLYDVDSSVPDWPLPSRTIQHTLRGHNASVIALAFSSDGGMIASAAVDCTVRIWDVHTGTVMHVIETGQNSVWAVTFSPDCKMIALGSDDSKIRLWNLDTRRPQSIFAGHDDPVTDLKFSPDSSTLASASMDCTVRVWDVAAKSPPELRPVHTRAIVAIIVSPDGTVAACAADDYTISLWDLATARHRHSLEGHHDCIQAISFSPDGEMLASASLDTTARLWRTGCAIIRDGKAFKGHSEGVTGVTFSPDGTILASISGDTVWLWHTNTGGLLHTLKGHSGDVKQVVFSPNGFALASASTDHTVRLWNAASAEPQATLEGHSGWVTAVAFSPDSKTLASASDDCTVRLWNVSVAAIQHTLEGHTGWVTAVAFSPDNETLVSTGNFSVRVWDKITGNLCHSLPTSQNYTTIAFSCDGKCISTNHGSLHLGSLSAQGCLFPGKARLSQGLHVNDDWVMLGTTKLMWLPKDFRATSVALRGSLLVLGHSSGGLTFLDLDMLVVQPPPRHWDSRRARTTV